MRHYNIIINVENIVVLHNIFVEINSFYFSGFTDK